MWLWLKNFVSQVMVAVGIDWPGMADGDKLNAAIGTGIGLIGIGLGYLGYKLTKRQGEIAETQHRIMQEQLQKRPPVEIAVVGMLQEADKPNGNVYLTLGARNIGSRAAEGFFWEVLLPSVEERVRFKTENWKDAGYGGTEDKGNMWWVQKDHYAKKLFAGTHVEVAWLEVHVRHFQESVVRWKVQGEDGPVPPQGFGIITLRKRPDGLLDVQPI